MKKEKPQCTYPKCTNVPKCRAEDPEYCWQPSHGSSTWPPSKDGACPSPFNHKYICDEHWELLEFIRVTLDVEIKLL